MSLWVLDTCSTLLSSRKCSLKSPGFSMGRWSLARMTCSFLEMLRCKETLTSDLMCWRVLALGKLASSLISFHLMDPPRQVARHRNGSGPVFRTFKRPTPSSQKVILHRPPRPLNSEIITAHIARCDYARSPTSKECARDISSSTSSISYHPYAEKNIISEFKELIENTENRPGLGTPLRKHPIPFDIKKDSQAEKVVITHPAYDVVKDERRLDEPGNQTKKVTLNRSKRVKLKQRRSHSEKVYIVTMCTPLIACCSTITSIHHSTYCQFLLI